MNVQLPSLPCKNSNSSLLSAVNVRSLLQSHCLLGTTADPSGAGIEKTRFFRSPILFVGLPMDASGTRHAFQSAYPFSYNHLEIDSWLLGIKIGFNILIFFANINTYS